MVTRNLLCVRIENRPGRAVGALVNGIRNWQDYREVELVSLKPAAADHGEIALDACFCSERDLALFCAEFGRRYLLSEPAKVVPGGAASARSASVNSDG